ncbi:MAG: TlpA family protein disulfide reductase [Azonexus sp.]
MTSHRSASLLFGLAALAGPFCWPADLHAAEAGGAALDFELSDGRAFVRLADLPKQVTVVNFWRSDCPSCVREMPLLAEAARQGPSQVVAIALQRPYETAHAPDGVLAALQPPVRLLHGPGEPRGLLARFGNRTGALPFTVVLDAQRRACARQTGEVTADWLNTAIHRCSPT